MFKFKIIIQLFSHLVEVWSVVVIISLAVGYYCLIWPILDSQWKNGILGLLIMQFHTSAVILNIITADDHHISEDIQSNSTVYQVWYCFGSTNYHMGHSHCRVPFSSHKTQKMLLLISQFFYVLS